MLSSINQDPVHTSGTETDVQILTRAVTSETSSPGNSLFKNATRDTQTRIAQEDCWQDEAAVYGGFIAIKDIRQLWNDYGVLQTDRDAMDDHSRPLRVRRAGCDTVLTSGSIQQHHARNLGARFIIFGQLHIFVVGIARPGGS